MEDILTYLNTMGGFYRIFHLDAVNTDFKPNRSTSSILTLTNTEKASACAEGIPKNEKTTITPPSISPRPAGDTGMNINMVIKG